MNAFAQFTNAWGHWTWTASWQIALLVCVIAALSYTLRGASPRLRYGLWLLVLLKALLPPTLTAFWGIGAWGVAPVVEAGWAIDNPVAVSALPSEANATSPASKNTPAQLSASWPSSPLVLIWLSGSALLLTSACWRYAALTYKLGELQLLDEGPARIEAERMSAKLGIRRTPDLYIAQQSQSPMLLGVLRPKIVLPQSLLDRLDSNELRMVLAHELVHWRRRDTWFGWLQVLVQCVYWFHPLVWLANARIRHERECACDEAVLREAGCDRDEYGQAILHAVTTARARSLAIQPMVGIFERGSLLQVRLEEIMSFDPSKRRFGWWSRAALATAALVLLPMASPAVPNDEAVTAPAGGGPASIVVMPARPKTNWPTIVSTTPEIGATDVEPGLKEISVTFDRDMEVGGYSWTGGGEFFPTSPEDTKPGWVDKRTCVLPVKLEKGRFYRVGINSTDHQNFKSELGVPAPTSAIYFVTEGAKRSVANRVRVPEVVEFSPENGATGVDPGTKSLRVTFSLSMNPDGYSWTGGGPTFPTIPEGKKTRWSRDGKTCTLPVELKPGQQYEVGINSFSHKNFASKWGVAVEPVVYKFQTSPGTE